MSVPSTEKGLVDCAVLFVKYVLEARKNKAKTPEHHTSLVRGNLVQSYRNNEFLEPLHFRK